MTKTEKLFPLEEIIRDLFPDLPEDGFELMDQYEEAIKQYGLNSKNVLELYDTLVGRYESMQEWLDAINRLALQDNYPV